MVGSDSSLSVEEVSTLLRRLYRVPSFIFEANHTSLARFIGRLAVHFRDEGAPVLVTWADGGERQSRCILGLEVPKELLAIEEGDPTTEQRCAELERAKRVCLEEEDFAEAQICKDEIESLREVRIDNYLRGQAARKSNQCAASFLVLDPRYAGPDEIGAIAREGKLGWCTAAELLPTPRADFTFIVPQANRRDTGSRQNFVKFDSEREKAAGS